MAQSLDRLCQALCQLPGVGKKSAQRMAFHLLQHNRGAARELAQALLDSVNQIGHCRRCNTFCELELCSICTDTTRDSALLCVVESPADMAALERTGNYRGYYYVLMGRISPLEGVGPTELNLKQLLQLLDHQKPSEVIVATNFTAEGDATAHVLMRMLEEKTIKASRLARGVPVGSELEYVDLSTIAHALAARS